MKYDFFEDVERDFRTQEEYEKKFFEEKIVKCKYLSDEFLYYMSLDKRINSLIDKYNESHQTDLNFETYALAFPYIVPEYAFMFLTDKDYFNKYGTLKIDRTVDNEFMFIIPRYEHIPTYDDYKKLIYDGKTEIPLTWHDYLKSCFSLQTLSLPFNSEEFRALLRKSFLAQRVLYDVNHNISYRKYNSFGHIDIDELSRINNVDYYKYWGRMRCNHDEELIDGKIYTFEFDLPIRENIPSYDEFIKIPVRQQTEEEYLEKIAKEEKICYDNLKKRYGVSNNSKKPDMTTDEYMKKIKAYKKSKARKFGKKIEKYDVNGKLIDTYADRAECIEKNNFTRSALSKHLSGKRKTLNGYIFKEVN